MRLISAAMLLACLATPAFAQSRGGITLYDDVGYQGARLPVDRDVRDFQGTGFNDRVSSIQVQSGTWEVCEDSNFRGRCLTVTRDTPNLVSLGFNDRISSIRMVSGGNGGDRNGNYGGNSYADRNGNYGDRNNGGYGDRSNGGYGDRGGNRGQDGLQLFADVGYRGPSRTIMNDIRNLQAMDFNDVASSVRVGSGVWELCEDSDYRGRCVRLDRDTPSLVDERFNDRVSSVRRVH